MPATSSGKVYEKRTANKAKGSLPSYQVGVFLSIRRERLKNYYSNKSSSKAPNVRSTYEKLVLLAKILKRTNEDRTEYRVLFLHIFLVNKATILER